MSFETTFVCNLCCRSTGTEGEKLPMRDISFPWTQTEFLKIGDSASTEAITHICEECLDSIAQEWGTE